MSMINIQTTVDGIMLAQQVSNGTIPAGSQDSPTALGSWSTSADVYISMVTQRANASNEGSSELQVKALVGDALCWTMQTFDNNVSHTAYIYNAKFNPGNAISPLQFSNMYSGLYLPSGTNPVGQPVFLHNYTWTAQGVVIETGAEIVSELSFILIDNSSGNHIGYFMWDPFITVGD